MTSRYGPKLFKSETYRKKKFAFVQRTEHNHSPFGIVVLFSFSSATFQKERTIALFLWYTILIGLLLFFHWWHRFIFASFSHGVTLLTRKIAKRQRKRPKTETAHTHTKRGKEWERQKTGVEEEKQKREASEQKKYHKTKALKQITIILSCCRSTMPLVYYFFKIITPLLWAPSFSLSLPLSLSLPSHIRPASFPFECVCWVCVFAEANRRYTSFCLLFHADCFSGSVFLSPCFVIFNEIKI